MDACLLDQDQIDNIPKFELMEHQKAALELLSNGRILYGGVGAGKSAVALAYYMESEIPKDVYVITTAKKRDSLEWMGEAAKFGIGTEEDATVAGVIKIDSWQSIGKYEDVQDAFFIFDEQRLVGHGAWVKSFLKIVKRNRWILLSATPGDVWLDYAPVFIANGWYKNITEFKREHVLYAPYIRFPKVVGYIREDRLERLRSEVLVEMPYIKHTERFLNFMSVGYDKELVQALLKHRWNPWEDRPIQDAGELWRLIRMVTNSDPSRLETIRFLMKFHPRLIIFYNFDYELEILRALGSETALGEWNGHRKQPIPDSPDWVYLVQYVAGSEGWNCIGTDSAILYSLTYSYKNYIQSQGRIDRLNTSYTDLYYYILMSSSPTDMAVKRSLDNKESFNEVNALEILQNSANLFVSADMFDEGVPVL